MIPVLLVLGLVAGRWWRAVLVLGVVMWTVALLAGGIVTAGQIPATAGLALVNTGAGVLVHQLVAAAARRVSGGTPPDREGTPARPAD